jgi:hypothetical protein
VTRRGIRRFVEALAEGQKPPGFRVRPHEVEDLRTAINLSAGRPGESTPDPDFVEDLFAELTELRGHQGAMKDRLTTVTPLRPSRRNVILSLAAAAALVAGTVGITESVDHGAGRPAASAIGGHAVLTGSFETTDRHKLGQITAFGGSPSWVFMNLTGTSYDGSVICLLQSYTGTVLASGMFTVHGGSGEWARTLPDGVTNLHEATIVTSSGVMVAAASFSNLSSAAR